MSALCASISGAWTRPSVTAEKLSATELSSQLASNDGGPTAGVGAVWGLGIDAGGSATRWSLACAPLGVLAQGEVGELSGLMLGTEAGRHALRQGLIRLAAQVHSAQAAHLSSALGSSSEPHSASPAMRVLAGFTGLGEEAANARLLSEELAEALAIPAQQVTVLSDVALAHAALFQPGQGILLYAGTGSIAVHIDARGQLHRAGGRGYILDDAGGGYWIALEALRLIWRQEDLQPGAWQHSGLARCVFEQLGGSDWRLTRERLYQGTRGEVGLLALAVAKAAGPVQLGHCGSGDDAPVLAQPDAQALDILLRAGQELGALANALLKRLGNQPVMLAGRVFELHPVIETLVREALPAEVWVQRSQAPVHSLAALKALSPEPEPGAVALAAPPQPIQPAAVVPAPGR